MSTPTETRTESRTGHTRAERMRQPLAADVLMAVADQHGVCVRPFTMEVGDPETGELRYVPVPCGSTLQSRCGPCARKARALRMTQCREGWHLTEELTVTPDQPTAAQRAQLTVRADLVARYRDAVQAGQAGDADDLHEAIREADDTLRQLGVRGRLPSPDLPGKHPPKRSTRRRQDAPNLPTRRISKTTLGREFAGRRLSDAEARLRRHQAALEAGVDPAAIVDVINQAQAERAAARAELNGRPAVRALTRQDVEAIIDSIGDVGAALTQAEPQSLTALYEALRLQMVYDHESRAVDVTVQPRGRVNSARVRGGT